MINLLPPEEKEELLLRKKNRLLAVLGIIFTIFLICLTLVLFSIKVYLLGENVILKEELNEVVKNYKSTNLSLVQNNIKEYNKDLDNLQTFYNNQIYFNGMLKSLASVPFPTGVYLIDVSITRKSDNTLEVNVYGFSDSRDNLLTLRDEINKEKNIKDPTFSQDSWTKSQNINFYLTFNYDNKN